MYSRLESRIIDQARLILPLATGRIRHQSFLLLRNRIISIGVNSYSATSKLGKMYGHRAFLRHSETSCIINAKRNKNLDLTKLTMYNVRIGMDNEIRLSKPCLACARMIEAIGIRHVYYTETNGQFEKLF